MVIPLVDALDTAGAGADCGSWRDLPSTARNARRDLPLTACGLRARRPSINGEELRTAGEALMARTAGAAGPSIDGRGGIVGRGAGTAGAGRKRSARW